MFDRMKSIKTNALLSAGLYTLLGVVLLVWPALSTNVLCTALGVVLALCGAVDILVFLNHRDGSLYAGGHLVLGVILAAVGVWLMTRPTLVAVIIPRVIGVFICIHGLGDVGDARTLRKGGSRRWTTALALGAVTLALGLVLVVNPFGAFTTVVRLIGLFLIYDGVSDLWITRQVSQVVKQSARNAALQEAVDVDFRDAEDDA